MENSLNRGIQWFHTRCREEGWVSDGRSSGVFIWYIVHESLRNLNGLSTRAWLNLALHVYAGVCDHVVSRPHLPIVLMWLGLEYRNWVGKRYASHPSEYIPTGFQVHL
jgi:hypothetical protein